METKNCQNCKQDFTIEPDDFVFYKKMNVPPPTFCPFCRMIRRMASVNHRSLYKINCSKCNKDVPSMYKPNSGFIVYCTECYFSDDFDAIEYGVDYDFNVPFFVQFFNLLKKVPQLHIEHQNNNGDGIVFSNYVYRSSRVYLSYGIVRSEDIMYSFGGIDANKICVDCHNFANNELCYELVDSNSNYGCSYLTKSHNCLDSQFLFDCNNCTNCFMSSNQRNQSYVFRNQKLSKETYEKELEKYHIGSRIINLELQEEYRLLMQNAIHKFAIIIKSENCSGDFITNSKNARDSFFVLNSENIKFVNITANTVTDSYDLSMAGKSSQSYELTVTGRGNDKSLFSYNIGRTEEIKYCDGCNESKQLFGCVNLKNKEYCILNKQYSKEEYFDMVEKIKKHMNDMPYIDTKGRVYKYGEYFPIDFSRFYYNETGAFEFYPISKEDILEMGYKFLENPKKENPFSLLSINVSDLIGDVKDDILNKILECEHKAECNELCTNSFRITESELNLYRKLKIAIPRVCPNCRYFERMKRTLPWKLWNRKCMKQGCTHEFETSYAPGRPEKVYCEKCYQKEVY